MTVRYIGSKARLAESIMEIIGVPKNGSTRFVDGFCGTGVVSRTAALKGWDILGNDTLLSSTYLAEASLLTESELDFHHLGSYGRAISMLNDLPGTEGFIWKTYSPVSKEFCGIERRYFSEPNAKQIDAIRGKIDEWHKDGLIGYREQALLVADLIEGANNVANIAGTYGCFLKKWTQQSSGSLTLSARNLFPEKIRHRIDIGDVFNIQTDESDVVYLDPPYTKRQYASYYHLPETIAYHDEPRVEGVAGLRPWKQNASPFCYKTKALEAIFNCVKQLSAHRIYLSYSSQGHVNLDDLLDSLECLGTVHTHELGEIGRYRPNITAAKTGSSVNEYLIEILKERGGIHE